MAPSRWEQAMSETTDAGGGPLSLAARFIPPAQDVMPPRGHKFSKAERLEIEAKRQATIAANLALRAARLAALTPEQRAAEFAARSARRREAARRGWITRRRNAGLPDGPAEPTQLCRLYLADFAALRQLAPDPKAAVRQLLEQVGMV